MRLVVHLEVGAQFPQMLFLVCQSVRGHDHSIGASHLTVVHSTSFFERVLATSLGDLFFGSILKKQGERPVLIIQVLVSILKLVNHRTEWLIVISEVRVVFHLKLI